MSYIISSEWLNDHLNSDDTAIIDVRFQMDTPEAGYQTYEAGHIPHAIYLDLNQDLSGPAGKHGGQRPLPDIDTFAQKLGDNGIDQGKTIVIYDQGIGMFAARAWWLLHYMGHQSVYVLDGGFAAWTAAGYPVTDALPKPMATTFKPEILSDAAIHIETVKAKKDMPQTLLIDSRSYDRYLGKSEKLHDKAGHIPGAKNYFWKNVLNEDGTWKSREQLEAIFADVPKDTEVIVSCGSGVSACPNIIALKTVGFTNVKLYPGSFSDWISYPENELETTES